MNNLSVDAVLFIILLFLFFVAFLITLNDAKGVLKTVISYFITTLMFGVIVFVGYSKFADNYIKAKDIDRYNQKIAIEQSQKEDENIAAKKIEKLQKQKEIELKLYESEAKMLKKDLLSIKPLLNKIYSVNDELYDNILSDDNLFEKYKRLSIKYYKAVNLISKKYKRKHFSSKLANKKLILNNCLQNAKKASFAFKKIFYDEMDIYFPKHRIPAKSAINDINSILKSL